MRAIQTAAIITGLRSRTDGSLGLTVSTPELSPAEKTVFFELQNLNLTLLITPQDEPELEVEKVSAEMGTKSQCQRIRGCIFKIWESKGKEGDFEAFYRSKTESIIDHLKKQIE